MLPLSKCKYIKVKWLKNCVKKALSFVCYSMLLPKPERPSGNPPENSIAVVFLASLGDLVAFCDAAHKLKASGKSITLICKRNNGTAEFAHITNLFDRIIEVDIVGKKRVENIKLLKQLEVDTVFCAPLGRHILPDIYACAIKANHRLFPDTMLDCSLPSLKKRIDKFADKLVSITQTHELKRYTEFLTACGLINEEIKPFRFQLPPAVRGKTMAVFPGAGGGAEKQWGSRNFAYVVQKLLEGGLITKALILGTASDSTCCDEMYGLLNQDSVVENLCGKTDIQGLLDILQSCCLTLANDSASGHLSIACGTPTIIICGMWQYGRFYPNPYLDSGCVSITDEMNFCQTCNSSRPLCGISPAPCLNGITARQIFECAADLLTNGKRKEKQC